MYCIQCGRQIPDDSRFCEFCGRPVDGASPQISAPAPAAHVQQSVVSREPAYAPPLAYAPQPHASSVYGPGSARANWLIFSIIALVFSALIIVAIGLLTGPVEQADDYPEAYAQAQAATGTVARSAETQQAPASNALDYLNTMAMPLEYTGEYEGEIHITAQNVGSMAHMSDDPDAVAELEKANGTSINCRIWYEDGEATVFADSPMSDKDGVFIVVYAGDVSNGTYMTEDTETDSETNDSFVMLQQLSLLEKDGVKGLYVLNRMRGNTQGNDVLLEFHIEAWQK